MCKTLLYITGGFFFLREDHLYSDCACCQWGHILLRTISLYILLADFHEFSFLMISVPDIRLILFLPFGDTVRLIDFSTLFCQFINTTSFTFSTLCFNYYATWSYAGQSKNENRLTRPKQHTIIILITTTPKLRLQTPTVITWITLQSVVIIAPCRTKKHAPMQIRVPLKKHVALAEHCRTMR